MLDFDLNKSDTKKRTNNHTLTKARQEKHVSHEDLDDEPVFSRQPRKVVVVEDDTAESELKLNTDPESGEREIKKTVEEKNETLNTSRSVELTPRQKQLLLPKAHMTKAERKRLEWELENAENEKLNKEKETQINSFHSGGNSNKNPSKQTKETPTKSEVKVNHAGTTPSKSQPKNNQSKSSQDNNSAKLVIEPDFVPGLGNLPDQPHGHFTSSDRQSVRTEAAGNQPSHRHRNTSQPQAEQSKELHQQSYQPLSKVQLKRLQWEKEKGMN